jgi:hypothetical protein
MLGHALLSLLAIAQMLGPFIADFNHTHVLNPRWPPLARFHNGQTMSMGLLLGLTTLYYTWRTKPTRDGAKEDLSRQHYRQLVLDHRTERDSVSRELGCRSGVWRGLPAVVHFWAVVRGELGWLVG